LASAWPAARRACALPSGRQSLGEGISGQRLIDVVALADEHEALVEALSLSFGLQYWL
jgi:hypothetical protein